MTVFAHIETWRPYTSCYVGLVGLTGAVLATPHPSPGGLIAAWSVPTIGWIAGLYGGDYFDRRLDAAAKPHRPIPSGRMQEGTALAMFCGLALLGGAVALARNPRTALLVAAALVCGVAYSTVFKGRGLSGNIVRGIITGFVVAFGSMMVVDVPDISVILVAIVFVMHDAGSNLVGALRDIDGDRAAGYRTFPVTAGMTRAKIFSCGLLVGAYGLSVVMPSVLGRSTSAGFLGLLIVAAMTVSIALSGLYGSGELRTTAYRSHTLLVPARVLLAGAFVVWGAPHGWTWALVVVAVGVTVSSQRLLRERHEFSLDSSGELTPTSSDIDAYVDTQLATLPTLSAALEGWQRVIDISLIEPDLRIILVADGTTIRRTTQPPDLPRIEILTSGAVFGDIFLHARTNPRRAYLTRRLQLVAGPADMIRLNQVFNAFIRNTPAAATPTGALIGRAAGLPATVTVLRSEADLQFPPTVVVSDTTLRDGEQMPGVAFTPAEKLELASMLIDAGVPLLEAGFPAVSSEEAAAVSEIVALAERDGRTLVQAIARPLVGDIDAAIRTGAHSIAIFIGTSSLHRSAKLQMSLQEVQRAVADAVRRVKQAGRQAVFAAEDATRTQIDDLVAVFDAAVQEGADTIGIADTVGIATPHTIAQLVAEVGARCPVPIAVHCHNDLGLATANSLAGIEAGASGVQCSVLGIGERAGNAPLEQVALALHLRGVSTSLRLDALQPIADHVADLLGVPIAPYQPVVGGNAFTHESGLHLDGLTQDPATYEPYRPELIGRERRIVLGKHSGVSAVMAVATEAGYVIDETCARLLLREVKRASQARRWSQPPSATEWVSQLLTSESRTEHVSVPGPKGL